MRDDSKILELVKGASTEKDGKLRLTCAAAFGIAEKHRVALLDIARVCNKNGIRISNCQLGCFS